MGFVFCILFFHSELGVSPIYIIKADFFFRCIARVRRGGRSAMRPPFPRWPCRG